MSRAATRPGGATADAAQAARDAGLRYVSDDRQGIRRVRRGSGFSFFSPNGKRITDEDELLRIGALAIPPAWTDVWICPDPRGHLQATGRDARGRKQHRYHARWTEVRDRAKYDRVIDFAQALPNLRRRVSQHLLLSGLPREKVLAAVVKLLEKTLIRVGNEEYARNNHSYGLTTLRDKHVQIAGPNVTFHFRGKSGVAHCIDIEDPRLARIIRNCQELPGYELFQYRDDAGQVCDVKSEDVNAYLREMTDQEFTAKDFRTWTGTVLAATALRDLGLSASETQAKKNIVQAIKSVAGRLGNTQAICRKCYVHPAILDSYLDGSLARCLEKNVRQRLSAHSLSGDESAVLRLLQQRLGASSQGHHRRAAA